jgi:hypothetical protein
MTENTIPLAFRIRRRWTRAALALSVPAAAIAVPVLAAAPAQAAADCTTDCVAVTVTPGLDRFTFAVSTTTSARISGRISSQDGTTTVATTTTPGLTTSTSLSVSNLPKQGTGYRYDVYGTDAAGNTWRETGYFTTLVRDVSVDLGTLQITDDSDSGGAGELVGGVQLIDNVGNTCNVKGLSPLNMTSTTSMSSGSPVSVGSSANLLCTGATADAYVQAYLADDDTDAWDDCDHRWPWVFHSGSWAASRGSDDCADWNYSSTKLTDPLPALGTGSKAVAFTSTSAEGDTLDIVGPEWILTGTATFTHRLPATALPATTGAAARLPLTVTPKRGGFTVGWTPQTVPGIPFYKYAVQYRRTGTTTWTTQLVNTPATSATVTGLEGPAGYDIQVLAEDINGNRSLRSASTVTTQPLTDPTTIGGWLAGDATLAPGTDVPFSATVSGDPRPVHLQTRRQGDASWTTHATLATNAADQVSGSYPVLPGVREWRLQAPASGYSEAATSAVRLTTATSSIDGFVTTKAVVAAGKVLKDRITVTPGAGRTVVVQFKKAGTSTWRTYQKVTASDSGQATARLKAFAGTRTWRVKVAQSVEHGTAAVSGSRVVRGR